MSEKLRGGNFLTHAVCIASPIYPVSHHDYYYHHYFQFLFNRLIFPQLLQVISGPKKRLLEEDFRYQKPFYSYYHHHYHHTVPLFQPTVSKHWKFICCPTLISQLKLAYHQSIYYSTLSRYTCSGDVKQSTDVTQQRCRLAVEYSVRDPTSMTSRKHQKLAFITWY